MFHGSHTNSVNYSLYSYQCMILNNVMRPGYCFLYLVLKSTEVIESHLVTHLYRPGIIFISYYALYLLFSLYIFTVPEARDGITAGQDENDYNLVACSIECGAAAGCYIAGICYDTRHHEILHSLFLYIAGNNQQTL